MKYKILITNDDSLKYEGIKVLTEYAKEFASEIMIVAPHTEKSACSHALTLRSEIRLYEEADLVPGVKTYTIDGTPADCVKFAKDALKYDFDIVFSGINDGFNMGDDINYSGTANAALEAEFHGKKGIAFSCKYHNLESSRYIPEVLNHLFNSEWFDKADVFNINFPENVKGMKFTKQGKRAFNGTYYLVGENLYRTTVASTTDSYLYRDEKEGTDYGAVDEGYISITPLTNNLNIR